MQGSEAVRHGSFVHLCDIVGIVWTEKGHNLNSEHSAVLSLSSLYGIEDFVTYLTSDVGGLL